MGALIYLAAGGLLAYVVLDATAQGLLTGINREYVPPTAQARVNTPLHRLYPACYLVVCMLAGLVGGWLLAAGGVLLRLGLFDPVLNATKKDPLFAVGSSAATDKLLRRLWPAHPDRLSAAVRIVATVGAGVMVYLATVVGN